MRDAFRGAVTLHGKQEYAVVHLASGSYVSVYGDGTTGRGISAALRRRPTRGWRWRLHKRTTR
jgi:hypothetical protein